MKTSKIILGLAIGILFLSFTNRHGGTSLLPTDPGNLNESSLALSGGDWTVWTEFADHPGIDYAIKCRRSDSWSDKNVYVWVMKIRNRLDKAIEFDYYFYECKDCKKKSAGRTVVKAKSEKALASDYFTETLPCGSVIWVSIDKIEYGK